MRLISTLAAFAFLTTSAFAGEQYTAANGFAVAGYDVVAYHALPQSPLGTSQPAAVPGRAEFKAEFGGATYLFSTAANRDAFMAEPAKFAPQFDGHCAFGAANGGKVPGNPNLWRIVDGKLYLNVRQSVVARFEADIPGTLTKAQSNWTTLEPAPASANAIPDFTPAAPLQ